MGMTSKLVICHPPIPASPDAQKRVRYLITAHIYIYICKIMPNVPKNEVDPQMPVIDDAFYL